MTTAFDINLALQYARIIAEAYPDKGGNIPIKRRAGVVCIENKSTDTQVYVLPGFRVNQVIWPGTDSLRDWLTDFEAWRKNIKSGSVHAGFDNAVESVFNDLSDCLRDLAAKNPEPSSIMSGGHSLGAACATIAAFKLDEVNFGIDSAYTYGEPRSRDAQGALDYNGRLGPCTFRCVNQADVVPWLPALLIPPTRLGYRHHNTEVYLDGTHAISGARGQTLVQLMDNGLEIFREMRRGKAALLHDHGIDAYISSLEAVASAQPEGSNA